MLASVQGSQKSATACVPLVISEMHVSPSRSPRCMCPPRDLRDAVASTVSQWARSSTIPFTHRKLPRRLAGNLPLFRGATLQDFPLSPSQRPFSPCIKLALPIEVPVFPTIVMQAWRLCRRRRSLADPQLAPSKNEK